MSESNRKPFNLEEALAGKPVVNGNGTVLFVTKTTLPMMNGVVLLAQKSDGMIISYHSESGKDSGSFLNYDLYMAPTTVTKWVNLYTTQDGAGYNNFSDNEAVADLKHNMLITNPSQRPRIGNKAHKITYEE